MEALFARNQSNEPPIFYSGRKLAERALEAFSLFVSRFVVSGLLHFSLSSRVLAGSQITHNERMNKIRFFCGLSAVKSIP